MEVFLLPLAVVLDKQTAVAVHMSVDHAGLAREVRMSLGCGGAAADAAAGAAVVLATAAGAEVSMAAVEVDS